MSLEELYLDKRKLEDSIAILSMRILCCYRISAHGCPNSKQAKKLSVLRSKQSHAIEELEIINHKIFQFMTAKSHCAKP